MIDAILRQVTRIPLRLRRHTYQTRLGQQHSRQHGAGLEFEQMREYQPGDAVRRINWAATARRGGEAPLVNVYYEEQDFTVMLLVDLSTSMEFGSSRLPKKARAAEICASLVYSALAAHNRVGFLGFTARVLHALPPSQTQCYQRAIPEHIVTSPTEPGPADFWLAATTLERFVKPPALVFLLSDFLTQETAQLARALTRLHRRHEVVALHLTDPLETAFPRGNVRIRLRDLETQRVQTYSLTHKHRQRLTTHAQAQHAQLQSLFERLRVAHLTLTPDSNYRHELSSLFVAGHRRISA